MDPFIGQILYVAFNFAPTGWALCNGQLLSISQNTALFSLLGTTYGGDGQTTFGLPDLRGRVPLHFGNGPGLSNYSQGDLAGTETTTLTVANLPSHAHDTQASSNAGTTPSPGGNAIANAGTFDNDFAAPANLVAMGAPTALTGNSQAFNNRQPYLVLTAIIALQGIFPSQP